MRISIAHISEGLSRQILADGWISRFSHAGRVIGFSLHTPSPVVAEDISKAWYRNLSDSELFYIDWSHDFPNLISFYGHLPVEINHSSISRFLHQIDLAWNSATTIHSASDAEVHVVGQYFSIYGNPFLPNAEECLANLSVVLQQFKQANIMGNLGHPPADKDERLFEFDLAKYEDIPLEERYVWESDLSVNTTDLLFGIESQFDSEEEMSCMSSLLGRPWDNGSVDTVVEWVRPVHAHSEIVGKEVLSMTKKFDFRQRCLASAAAARVFGLESDTSVFKLTSSSNDKKFLTPFTVSRQMDNIDRGSEQPFWPLPNRPCYSKILSAAISFSAK